MQHCLVCVISTTYLHGCLLRSQPSACPPAAYDYVCICLGLLKQGLGHAVGRCTIEIRCLDAEFVFPLCFCASQHLPLAWMARKQTEGVCTISQEASNAGLWLGLGLVAGTCRTRWTDPSFGARRELCRASRSQAVTHTEYGYRTYPGRPASS